MQFKYRNTGEITKDGRMIFDNRKLFDNQIDSLRGERFELYLRKERIPATTSQISYLIGGIMKEAYASEAFSHYESPKQLFDKVFSPIFLHRYEVVDDKLTIKKPKLNELSKEEISDLIDKVKIYLLTEFEITVGEAKEYK